MRSKRVEVSEAELAEPDPAGGGESFDVQRFTSEDLASGRTAGWSQWTAWDRRGSVTWAWFRRDPS